MVDDQEKALAFYTKTLGFQKKHDIPVGEYRWITVTSPEGHADGEPRILVPLSRAVIVASVNWRQTWKTGPI